MDEDGFAIYDENKKKKVSIGYESGYDYTGKLTNYPYIKLGIGSGEYTGNTAGCICKLGNGIWIGDANVISWGGEYPGGAVDPNTDVSSYCRATGIFIRTDGSANSRIWKYIKGVPTEL